MAIYCVSSWPRFTESGAFGQLWAWLSAALILGLCTAQQSSAQVTIFVTTIQQGVTNGQCSLQEAIYSAELKVNIAVGSTDPDAFYTTRCVPGTGTGDTIVLPPGAVFTFDHFWDGDSHNAYGPTATPIIFAPMVIEGNGATLQWVGVPFKSGNARLFTVGRVNDGGGFSGTGDLVLKNVYVQGFHIKGGDGGQGGGGGGLGAGGAIFVDGFFTVENSTFENNGAVGGNGGGFGIGGGGGGLSGNGGDIFCVTGGVTDGGGGGGSRGNGGMGTCGTNEAGGGGTVFSGGNSANVGGPGGFRCGGNGGDGGNDGHNAACYGGGGGGGGEGGDGGQGSYGGGGGSGGNGGFGGGGGAGASSFFHSSGGTAASEVVVGPLETAFYLAPAQAKAGPSAAVPTARAAAAVGRWAAPYSAFVAAPKCTTAPSSIIS